MANAKSVQVVCGVRFSEAMLLVHQLVVVCLLICGLVPAANTAAVAASSHNSGLQSEESAPPFKVQKCRIGCLEKVQVQWIARRWNGVI